MTWSDVLVICVTSIYFVLLAILLYLLSPKMTRKLEYKEYYRENLHKFVISRQILLFFLPLMLSLVIFGLSFIYDQLLSLIILGLSINVFWVIQLPLLTKAQLSIDFSVDQVDRFSSELALTPKLKQVVYVRLYNLGFSTLKNGTVLIYFGEQFKTNNCKIVPCDDDEYYKLDFTKRFSIQKVHAGVLFTPKDNFLTIPPQEWFVFPIVVDVPHCQLDGLVTVQFYSENSWGVTKHTASIKTK